MFREYLDRYCKTYGLTDSEAVTHKMVRLVGYHYGLTDSEIDAYGYLPFA